MLARLTGDAARPPLRQPGGGSQNCSKKQGYSKSRHSNETINATTVNQGHEMKSDDMLLHLIEAWPHLSVARKKMIWSLLRQSDRK